MTKLLAIVGLTLTLAACGTQTDARVSDTASAAPSVEQPTAAASAPAESEAPPADSAPAAPAGAFVSVNCSTGQQAGSDAAPTGTMVDGVSAELDAAGVPTITVPADAAPAQALGSADLVAGSGPAATAERGPRKAGAPPRRAVPPRRRAVPPPGTPPPPAESLLEPGDGGVGWGWLRRCVNNSIGRGGAQAGYH